jgi:hypothetical protein
VVTVGGTHALFIAFQACSARRRVLVLSPHWMAIPSWSRFVARRALSHAPVYLDALRGAAGAGALAARLRGAGPRDARHLPQHAQQSDRRRARRASSCSRSPRSAIERDLWVVSDEAYEHLLFDGART